WSGRSRRTGRRRVRARRGICTGRVAGIRTAIGGRPRWGQRLESCQLLLLRLMATLDDAEAVHGRSGEKRGERYPETDTLPTPNPIAGPGGTGFPSCSRRVGWGAKPGRTTSRSAMAVSTMGAALLLVHSTGTVAG